jgi:histidine triad (HIT) family protein
LSAHSGCLFCKIVAKAEPAAHVHEDEHCIAFMDIHPLGKGHVLVIPRQHAQKLDELGVAHRMHLFAVCDRIVEAQRRAGFGVNGSHLLLNDGKAANQHVPHVHFHLVPRSGTDSLGFFFRILLHFTGLFGFRTSAQTLQAQAELIRRQLARTQDSGRLAASA